MRYDDYFDLFVLLGRISVLVDVYYDSYDSEQMDTINTYYSTLMFHIDRQSDRKVILKELERVTLYIDTQLKKRN